MDESSLDLRNAPVNHLTTLFFFLFFFCGFWSPSSEAESEELLPLTDLSLLALAALILAACSGVIFLPGIVPVRKDGSDETALNKRISHA